MADVQRAGRVGADEFDEFALAVERIGPAKFSRRKHAANRGARQPAARAGDGKPRPGDFRRFDQFAHGYRRDDSTGHIERIFLSCLASRKGQRVGPIAVVGVARHVEREFRRLDPRAERFGILDARPNRSWMASRTD